MQDPVSRASLRSAGIEVYPKLSPKCKDILSTNIHLAIGMFDGVHLGHQAVIEQAVAAAISDPDSGSGVLTFDPHPSRVLRPDNATELLVSLPERIELMRSLDLDYVFVQEFTREYSEGEASKFVTKMKTVFPGLKSLHVGSNFRFGAGRIGSVDTMLEQASRCGIEVHVLDRKVLGGEAISSSRIRRHLASGEIEYVNEMLGFSYTVSGRIVEGKQIGRTLGFPTLNVQWRPEALPRFGVYKAWLLSEKGGDPQPGVANFGLRPTVSGNEDPLLELHLLEPKRIPETGSTIHVALTNFLRPEQVFPSITDLKEQIFRDIKEAAAIPGDKVESHKFRR